MELKPGAKVSASDSEVELIVVRAPVGSGLTIEAGDASLLLGKRLSCQFCATEVLVARAGDGLVRCHGSELEPVQAKSLPASD